MSLTTTPPLADMATDTAADTGSQHIRDTLRDAIVERRLAPGTKLSESDVGELFNVSRTLVRAALQALSMKGSSASRRTAAPLSPIPRSTKPARSSRPAG